MQREQDAEAEQKDGSNTLCTDPGSKTDANRTSELISNSENTPESSTKDDDVDGTAQESGSDEKGKVADEEEDEKKDLEKEEEKKDLEKVDGEFNN